MSSTRTLNFAGGEISPSLYGRTDLVKYATGLRTCRNFLVQRHGGASNRAGFAYDAETKSSGAVRLIKFVYSDTQTYLLEFGALYIRFHQDGAPVLSGDVPYEVVTTYTVTEVDDLQVVQSADVLTIVHPSHPPRRLSRLAHTNWTLADEAIGATLPAPTGLGVGGVAGSTTYTWGVTAVDAFGTEGPVATVAGAYVVPEADLGWDAVAGAASYNIYRGTSADTLGFVGSSQFPAFDDYIVIPDSATRPVVQRVLFTTSGNYPAVVSGYQQRRLYGNTTTDPETVRASRTGALKDFNVSTPIEDDDAVEFTLAARQVQSVRHLLDLGRLLVFTASGIWSIEGDTSGTMTPTGINARQVLYHGASTVPPVVVGNAALFVQARGSTLRDLVADASAGFSSADLSLFASHLFDGYRIVDMDFQETPHSTLWCVRSDGTLVALTYLRDQEVFGWHRHDTDGVIENVCVVPEGQEDRVYICVRRTISGVERRYIERLASRTVTETTDVRDLFFVDSGLTYDGRNVGLTTMTLTGGTAWDDGETLTLTASAGFFTVGDVGNAIFLTDPTTGAVLSRLYIEGYTSSTVVVVRPTALVPVGSRGIATQSWSRAVETFAGLSHLEGKAVAVYGDGNVVASPNNEAYATVTVTGGEIVLDRAYAVVHVGLPYLSDLQTLDIDQPSGPSVKTHKILVNRVTVQVEKSRAFWVGGAPPTDDSADPLELLDEGKVRDDSDDFSPIALRTEPYATTIQNRWNTHGRVFLRQVDPVPLTVLAILPEGDLPPAR